MMNDKQKDESVIKTEETIGNGSGIVTDES